MVLSALAGNCMFNCMIFDSLYATVVVRIMFLQCIDHRRQLYYVSLHEENSYIIRIIKVISCLVHAVAMLWASVTFPSSSKGYG